MEFYEIKNVINCDKKRTENLCNAFPFVSVFFSVKLIPLISIHLWCTLGESGRPLKDLFSESLVQFEGYIDLSKRPNILENNHDQSDANFALAEISLIWSATSPISDLVDQSCLRRPGIWYSSCGLFWCQFV